MRFPIRYKILYIYSFSMKICPNSPISFSNERRELDLGRNSENSECRVEIVSRVRTQSIFDSSAAFFQESVHETMLLVACVVGMVVAIHPRLGFANVAEPDREKRPEPPPQTNVPFKITGDSKTKENRLIIPKKFLRNAGVVGWLGNGDPGSIFERYFAGLASFSVLGVAFDSQKKSWARRCPCWSSCGREVFSM